MIAAILAPLLLAAGADPCAPVARAPAPDREAAALYRRVGDAERDAGSAETAAVAYRAALALDPADAASRGALEELCREAAAVVVKGPFAEGLARMEKGDFRGAVASFRSAQAARPDPSAALLEGICLYRLGDDAEAIPPLRRAEAAEAHRDAARFYLGLVALRRGEGAEAAALLGQVASTSAFGQPARELARLAHREGPLVLSVLAEGGWDSNAGLAPGDTLVSAGSGALWNVTASALYRPQGESGPYLRASGSYHDQVQIPALDIGGPSAAAGWQLGHGARALLAEYGYDYRVLDGSPYLSAHRLLVSAWAPVGPLSLGATAFVQLENYRSPDYAPFSGTWAQAEPWAWWPLGARARTGIGYHLGADEVEEAYLSWREHGPRAQVRALLGTGIRLLVEVGFTFRRYRADDPTLGARREDRYLDLDARVAWDLDARWTAWISFVGRRATSSIPDFSYLRVVPTAGLAWAMGL